MKTIIIDGVEYNLTPKVLFKEGDWITTVNDDGDVVIEKVVEFLGNKVRLIDTDGVYMLCPQSWLNHYHLWTIQDAKDGDVLSSGNPFIFRGFGDKRHTNCPTAYCGINSSGTFILSVENDWWTANDVHPAAKEQCDLLFSKMKESGYEWDAEKKELKKIDNEDVNGEDYGIDGLWHAQRILEKTLGNVGGYQTDDGILEHKAAITAVKKLYEQKLAWSEEDEITLNNISSCIKHCQNEDIEAQYNGNRNVDPKRYESMSNWLKSLKPRQNQYDKGYNDGYSAAKYNHWKPSKEQLEALNWIAYNYALMDKGTEEKLQSLYNCLKNL